MQAAGGEAFGDEAEEEAALPRDGDHKVRTSSHGPGGQGQMSAGGADKKDTGLPSAQITPSSQLTLLCKPTRGYRKGGEKKEVLIES